MHDLTPINLQGTRHRTSAWRCSISGRVKSGPSKTPEAPADPTPHALGHKILRVGTHSSVYFHPRASGRSRFVIALLSRESLFQVHQFALAQFLGILFFPTPSERTCICSVFAGRYGCPSLTLYDAGSIEVDPSIDLRFFFLLEF
uniref:Uncharacterized protein n=1 Tax=Steinernema glaseri TaxID=37863 RepID=A0A1I7YT66_9BILA